MSWGIPPDGYNVWLQLSKERNYFGLYKSRLSEVFQLFAKPFSCKEYAAFYRAEREIHLFSDLIIFVSRHVHVKRYPVIVRKFVKGGRNLFYGVRTFRGFKTGILRNIKMVKIFRLINDCGFPYRLTIIINENISHDRKDPPFEVDIVNIFLFIVESFEGSVLQEVSCFFFIGRELIGETQEIALKA